MRKSLRMTWRAGAATIALAAATLLVGPATASAQMHTEVIGAPAAPIGGPGSGALQVGGSYGESGLTTVREDHGGPSLRSDGREAGLAGPACTFEIVGSGGRGYNEVSNESCGAGGFVEHHGDGSIEAHYP